MSFVLFVTHQINAVLFALKLFQHERPRRRGRRQRERRQRGVASVRGGCGRGVGAGSGVEAAAGLVAIGLSIVEFSLAAGHGVL